MPGLFRAAVRFFVSRVMATGAVPGHWIRWIGLVPRGLGIKALGGGRNLAACVPVLQRVPKAQWPYLFAVFAIGVVLWCALAEWLGGNPDVQAARDRTGHWIVPVVCVAGGVWVVV